MRMSKHVIHASLGVASTKIFCTRCNLLTQSLAIAQTSSINTPNQPVEGSPQGSLPQLEDCFFGTTVDVRWPDLLGQSAGAKAIGFTCVKFVRIRSYLLNNSISLALKLCCSSCGTTGPVSQRNWVMLHEGIIHAHG